MSPKTTYPPSASVVASARARGLFGLLLLVGVAIFGGASTHADSVPLFSFSGSDGATPHGALMQGSDGNFYGTTEQGGASGFGTVFKMTPGGSLTTLYSFSYSDGAYPDAGLVQGSDGDFYGTTQSGGTNGGYGTVFKITPGGSLSTLHSFSYTDGASPLAELAQGCDGNFYGTTSGGGANTWGTVFKITPGGSLTTLHNFNLSDGANPFAELVEGSDGNFYGTTWSGGTYDEGTVFKIESSGTLTTLYSFNSGTGGQNPFSGLVEDDDGNFYGTTYWFGATGWGTVFKITSDGTLTTLHNFNLTDGYEPQGTLVRSNDGSLYGTTQGGGAYGGGEVFKVTPTGDLTVLYSFNGSDGSSPWGGLAQGSDGNLYGTTAGGGAYGLGTVFKLTLHIGPPTNKEQCKEDNWMTFNVPRKFKSQGDCVEFVNTGK